MPPKRRASSSSSAASASQQPVKKAAIAEHVKIAAWNVNGLRGCLKNSSEHFYGFIDQEQPDVLFLSEIKCTEDNHSLDLKEKGYEHVKWNPAKAKKGGYSGTVMFAKIAPISVTVGLGEHDDPESETYEGRVITAEFPDFVLVHVYVPNSGQKLERLNWRTKTWDPAMLTHLKTLEQDTKKPVIWCGDLNVAHLDIDVHDPKGNKNKTAGFTDAERDNFSLVLKDGFVDLYRHFYPEEKDCYTYWGFRFQARAKNKGWRLDYFVASENLVSQVENVRICKSQLGSDHVPLLLTLSTKNNPNKNN